MEWICGHVPVPQFLYLTVSLWTCAAFNTFGFWDYNRFVSYTSDFGWNTSYKRAPR